MSYLMFAYGVVYLWTWFVIWRDPLVSRAAEYAASTGWTFPRVVSSEQECVEVQMTFFPNPQLFLQTVRKYYKEIGLAGTAVGGTAVVADKMADRKLEKQRIENERQRIENERQRIENESYRDKGELEIKHREADFKEREWLYKLELERIRQGKPSTFPLSPPGFQFSPSRPGLIKRTFPPRNDDLLGGITRNSLDFGVIDWLLGAAVVAGLDERLVVAALTLLALFMIRQANRIRLSGEFRFSSENQKESFPRDS